jgi:hypothetical protein
VTVLEPCDEPKFVPVIVTGVVAGPDAGLRFVMAGGGGVTVKFMPLLATPATVTITVAVPVTMAGTCTVMLVGVQMLAGAAGVPLNVTVFEPCDEPKFVPVIVTGVLTGPEEGFRLLMLGGGDVTAKVRLLLGTPETVTTTVALPTAIAVTITEILVGVQMLAGAVGVPLNVTVFEPCEEPKFVPVMITGVVTGPDDGFRFEMVGGGGVTVKFVLLLGTPPTVTTTVALPVAIAGTSTVMLVGVQMLAGAVGVPLKVTVLEPCEEPKFVPVMTTCEATGPDVGFRLVMPGEVPAPAAALNATTAAPQLLLGEKVAVAARAPVVGWMRSSTMNLVFGAAGTISSTVNPLPAV